MSGKKYVLCHRRGTTAEWSEKNTTIPMEGEIVIEIDEINYLHKLKIGDGIHAYADLAYLKAGDEIVTQVLAQALPRVITITLDIDKWVEVTCETDPNLGYYGQTVVLDGITNYSRLDLQPNADMIAEFKQLDLMFVTENKEGTITVYSVGDKPLKSYTMQATIVETEITVDSEKVVGIPIGTSAVKPDWNQTDETKLDYIKNKPNLDEFATKEYVNNIVDLGTPEVDHTHDDRYYTEAEVDNLLSGYLTSYTETDPTVPDWAKSAVKPTYTASEVGAEASGAVAQHNTATDTHNDIRLLIEGVTTNKLNVSDVINNLTTNVSNKALSAAQGIVLKSLIDDKVNSDELDDAIISAIEDLKANGDLDGKDGVSATHSWNGTTLTITSASGTSSADLKGEPGEDGRTPVITINNGYWYVDGVSTNVLAKGDTGKGISSVSKKSTSGLVDTYTITFTDSTTSTFIVTNGEDGEDGITPTFKCEENKLYVSYNSGSTWEKLQDIQQGVDGTSVTISKVEESSVDGGSNIVTFSDGKTLTVKNGSTGKDGTSVTIKSISESTADGGSNIVTFSDGKTLTVKNGIKGKDGYTPVKGTDYWTAEDKEEIVTSVLSSLPNASGVTF